MTFKRIDRVADMLNQGSEKHGTILSLQMNLAKAYQQNISHTYLLENPLYLS